MKRLNTAYLTDETSFCNIRKEKGHTTPQSLLNYESHESEVEYNKQIEM